MPLDGRTYDHDDVEVLIKARDGISKSWCQGTMRMGERHCAAGWIEAVAGKDRMEHICQNRLVGLIHPLPLQGINFAFPYSIAAQNVMYFNDTHSRESVIELFDVAIANAIDLPE